MFSRERSRVLWILFCLAFFLLSYTPLSAQLFDSDTYRVSHSVLFPGGYATSTTYGLLGVISQMAIGTSTTGGLYQAFGGFLYFPFVSTPTVSATAGSSEVALTWTAASASTGWAVGGYAVGQATVSGGPYSYTDVGSVLASTRTGLTNGTTYYFVVRVADALGNYIATSTQASATPAASGGGGGGGGGGGATYGTGNVTFSGRAYPRSLVTFLKDAQTITTTTAGSDGTFYAALSNLTAGTYIFSVYSEDKDGRRSNLVTFPTSITAGATTDITGIFIAPTIGVDKEEVRRGDNIAIFGQSAPQADIVISVHSDEEFFSKTVSDKDGIYLYNFDTVILEYGSHTTKSKAAIGNQLISGYSASANFRVGTQNIFALFTPKPACSIRGDVNYDCKVNLIDFSIVAYWYNRPNPPKNVDINSDGKVSLIDFSIMAYYWTG